jgi:D-xylose 1-dehydrogenase (NADP+, D-xylono-1,5-lactone-forming)
VTPDRLRVGVLGAASIADRALIPAMLASPNATPVAIASREPARATTMAARHGIPRVHTGYEALLNDPDVDAVYVALANHAHRPWTLAALAAGKHVLCEKPLGLNAMDVQEMAAAASNHGRTLMEAFMYRFHPRMIALHETTRDVRYLPAAFSFTLAEDGDYRWQKDLGGGALLDIGCYTLDVARWFLGEPTSVQAVMHEVGVDMSVATVLGFGSGAEATTWASFEAPEHQVMELVCADSVRRVDQPFTARDDQHNSYQLMVEAFAASVLGGSAPPRSLADSIGTARLMDRVRVAAGVT